MTAQIKLIPKKGDLKKIGNWRPISLLSNFYKIISRVINNRLKKVTNRILSRAQKGFNQKRFIQEAILNTLETIDYCKNNNIKGVLVSIDQSKAFDCVGHTFMEKVYSFFGFGDRIKKWLKSIGTGRSACVSLENGNQTDFFSLEKGHAQGDSPSPLLYNFAAQILLFKIELDTKIKRIRPNIALPGPIIGKEPYQNESNRETDKCDCFADDNTVSTLLNFESLNTLKNILEDFKRLSGLSTNYEKTIIMRIGDLSGEIEDDIKNLGFQIVDSFKLLGFYISNTDAHKRENFVAIKQKISSIIRFWDRFYLSLQGKITVYKTLLMPQQNYVGTILTPEKDILVEIEQMMEKFVTGGFQIAKSRLYVPANLGGIGLFHLETFITALQCTWIKKAFENCNENWKYDIVTESNLNLNNVGKNLAQYDFGNTLLGIVSNFRKFAEKFAKVGNNYLKTPILNCNIFGYGHGMNEKYNYNFFNTDANGTEKFEKITWEVLTTHNAMKSRGEIETFIGCNITNVQYNGLKSGYKIARKKYHKEGEKAFTLEDFVLNPSKGSKRFRNILTKNTEKGKGWKIQNLTQVKTYKKLTGVENLTDLRAAHLLSSWNNTKLHNKIRTFLFKFYNNILGLNSRVAKFNNEIDPSCTFCTANKLFPAEKESFSHLFYYCPTTNKLLSIFLARYFTINSLTAIEFFASKLNEKEDDNMALQLALDIFRYYIWNCKLEKKIPTVGNIFNEINDTIGTVYSISIKTKHAAESCNFFRHGGE